MALLGREDRNCTSCHENLKGAAENPGLVPASINVVTSFEAGKHPAFGRQLMGDKKGWIDPTRLKLGKKGLVRDMPGGEDRWQVRPEGVARVIVNGQTIVKDGELTGARGGRVLRIGNPA